MDSKNIRCGLDVYNNEPASGKDEINTLLSQHPNVYGTHHIGASTEQAQFAIAKAVLDLIFDFEKGHVNNCVNLEKSLELRPTLITLTIRHGNKIGVLSNILDILKEQNINVDQLENREFAGKSAAFSKIYSEAAISNDIIRQIESLSEVYQVTVK
jgi:D-3-phosphoglycerate dehydrogenase